MAFELCRSGGGDVRPTDDPVGWKRRLNERLRSEFIAGAEEEWRKRTGQEMTAEELEQVLQLMPGSMVR